LALLKREETATFGAAKTGIFGAPICASRCLRQHCRYHHKRRDYNFGSKAHHKPPDLDWKKRNIYTPSATLAQGPINPAGSGPSKSWLKIKNPNAPAATRAVDGSF
jgi:hypothetical protein